MTKRLESFLLEFLRTLRFPLEKTRYSGLRNPYHAKKNVNDPVNQRVPWQIEPRRAKEKPLSDGAMRRPSILAGLPGALPSPAAQYTERMRRHGSRLKCEARGKRERPSSFQQAPSCFFHDLFLLPSLSYSRFPPCYLTFCLLLGLAFIHLFSLYPSLLFSSFSFHCLNFPPLFPISNDFLLLTLCPCKNFHQGPKE